MFGKRASLFTRLAALTKSGITLRQAFTMLAGSSSGAQQRGFQRAAAAIDKGGDLREALEVTELFDAFEIELIVAGENSGQLPESFEKLAEQCEQRSKHVVGLAFGLAYPVLLVHAAIFLPNLETIISDGLFAYLKVVGWQLGWLYSLIGLPLLVFWVLRQAPGARYAIDSLVLGLPLIGGLVLRTETARTVRVIGGLYESGTPIIKAVEQGVQVTRNGALRALWVRVGDRLGQGLDLTAATAAEPLLPAMLCDSIASGERSGTLDRMFASVAASFEEEARARLKLLLGIITGAIFMLAAGLVAYKVISFYAGYFNQISSIR